MKTQLILGHGYTGQYLAQQFPETLTYKTKRHLEKNRQNDPDWVRFDYQDPLSYNLLPEADCAIATLAFTDLEFTKKFWQSCHSRFKKFIIIGSTSRYNVSDGQIAYENSQIHDSDPRVICEEYLRSKGAIIAVSSGIIGPQRNPIEWLKRGLIQDRKSLVNLVPVNDLVSAIVKLSESALPGESFNINSYTESWSNIIAFATKQNWIDVVSIKTNDTDRNQSKPNKIVSSEKIKNLGWTQECSDVFEYLNSIQY